MRIEGTHSVFPEHHDESFQGFCEEWVYGVNLHEREWVVHNVLMTSFFDQIIIPLVYFYRVSIYLKKDLVRVLYSSWI